MRKTLYLIRHAQSHPTAECHDSAWPLSNIGAGQAQSLSPLLAALGIQKVFSSPYERCLQTIQPFAGDQDIPLVVRENLRERLIAKSLMTEGFAEAWRKSWADFTFALPDCESSSCAQRRFSSAVSAILQETDADTIAICSHGNVIGLFLNLVDSSAGIKEADRIRNPDVLKIVVQDNVLIWDRLFKLPGLDDIASDYKQTPVQ